MSQDNDPDRIILENLSDPENNNDNNDPVPNDFTRSESFLQRLNKILSLSENSDDSDDTSTTEILPTLKPTNLSREFKSEENFESESEEQDDELEQIKSCRFRWGNIILFAIVIGYSVLLKSI
jgi:hypothetical protein